MEPSETLSAPSPPSAVAAPFEDGDLPSIATIGHGRPRSGSDPGGFSFSGSSSALIIKSIRPSSSTPSSPRTPDFAVAAEELLREASSSPPLPQLVAVDDDKEPLISSSKDESLRRRVASWLDLLRGRRQQLGDLASGTSSVARDLGRVLVVLVSAYTLPGSLWKLITYVHLRKRRAYPLASWRAAVVHWLLSSSVFGIRGMKARLLEPAAVRGETSLESLPDELLVNVMQHLSAEALAELGQCNRRLHRLSESEEVWRHLLERDFGSRIGKAFPMTPLDFRRSTKSGGRLGKASAPRRKWQYRVLAETAALCGPCDCPPPAPLPTGWRRWLLLTSGNHPNCCYTRFARLRSRWLGRHRAKWSEASDPPRVLLARLALHARANLYHLPLTPVKLLGLAISPLCVGLLHVRLSHMVVHGVFGSIARDLHQTTLSILRDAPVEDGHWLAVTGPLAVAALCLRDVDWALSRIVRSPHLAMVCRVVLAVAALGSAGVSLFVLWQIYCRGASPYAF
ncbi:F-box protein 36b [Blastocladiella emersonii ATCC 22665]|nr:F-box protein 36b [Blastocladiella emersonii ATCC 22665]